MKKDNYIVFGSPKIEDEEIQEVVDSIRSGWIGTGPKVHKFEEMFREYKGPKHAIALNSCTAGLHLSLLALKLQKGSEVIVPTMTFAATANAVIHAGCIPVFVDCQKDTMNIDPDDIERKITKKTKAIIPVHFAGRPCDMDAIMQIAKKHDLKVIEDCAHAIETEYKGKKAGTFGDLGCFSFYVTKNIVTGEGGMVITSNDEYAAKIKILALHGMSQDAWKRFSDEGYKHYQVVYAGYKYNMMDIQAAFGIHQLPRIDKYWQKRKEIWNQYNNEFHNLPITLPAPVQENTRHAYHLYTIMVDKQKTGMTRDQFMFRMNESGIGTGVHYVALHLHPFYQNEYGYKRGDFSNAEWISDRTVSLPFSAKLDIIDVNNIINTVKNVINSVVN